MLSNSHQRTNKIRRRRRAALELSSRERRNRLKKDTFFKKKKKIYIHIIIYVMSEDGRSASLDVSDLSHLMMMYCNPSYSRRRFVSFLKNVSLRLYTYNIYHNIRSCPKMVEVRLWM